MGIDSEMHRLAAPSRKRMLSWPIPSHYDQNGRRTLILTFSYLLLPLSKFLLLSHFHIYNIKFLFFFNIYFYCYSLLALCFLFWLCPLFFPSISNDSFILNWFRTLWQLVCQFLFQDMTNCDLILKESKAHFAINPFAAHVSSLSFFLSPPVLCKNSSCLIRHLWVVRFFSGSMLEVYSCQEDATCNFFFFLLLFLRFFFFLIFIILFLFFYPKVCLIYCPYGKTAGSSYTCYYAYRNIFLVKLKIRVSGKCIFDRFKNRQLFFFFFIIKFGHWQLYIDGSLDSVTLDTVLPIDPVFNTGLWLSLTAAASSPQYFHQLSLCFFFYFCHLFFFCRYILKTRHGPTCLYRTHV